METVAGRRQHLRRHRPHLACPPAGVLYPAAAASLSLPRLGLSRALLRALLLEVSSLSLLLQLLHLIQAMWMLPLHRRYPDPRPDQELPDVPHELANPRLAEKLPRVIRSYLPVQGKVSGPLGVLPVIKAHELPEGQPAPCRLGPHILSRQLHEGQVHPRGPCHLAVTST